MVTTELPSAPPEDSLESIETTPSIKSTKTAPSSESMTPDPSNGTDGRNGTNGTDSTNEKDDAAAAPAVEAAPLPPVPEHVTLNQYQVQTLAQLYDLGATLGLRVGGSRSKHQLVFDILVYFAKRGTVIEATGILEIAKDGSGVLRDEKYNFKPLPDDIFVPTALVRKYQLRPGQMLTGTVRGPSHPRDRLMILDQISAIEGKSAETWEPLTPFDKLTPLFPNERIVLENRKTKSVSVRCVDIIAPLGKGQRGLICAPPRGGKTVLLKDIAQSIQQNHPEIELMILLLDERPEEVTDFQETVQQSPTCHVTASTFDEPAERHQQVAELVMERAKRLVEMGRDVVVLLDSITRLSRGYNNCVRGNTPLGSGGMTPQALQKAGKFFGTARKVEEGGSLTVLATALIETESKMDEVIFEEFKGKGNMEVTLDRELVERRIYPAINISKTGTRKDDLLYHPDEFRRISAIRRQLAQLPAGEAMEVLTKHLRATQNNAELLLTGLR
jgi:transcription termination factor Rho